MKNITVIGAGGVGTRFIPLAQHMFNMSVMDGDTFTRKNLARQVLRDRDVGKNKAVAMAERYGVEAIPEFLTKPEQLEDHEFVVCIPDNHKCRVIALDACDQYGFGMVLAGNEEFTANAMYYHGKYKDTSVDPRIRYPDILKEFEREEGETCLERVITKPQTSLANSFASDFALALTMYWCDDELPPDEIIKEYAPFEFLWERTNMRAIRGWDK